MTERLQIRILAVLLAATAFAAVDQWVKLFVTTPAWVMAPQSTGRICEQPWSAGEGRATQIFFVEPTAGMPWIWERASRTVSLPVIGNLKTLWP